MYSGAKPLSSRSLNTLSSSTNTPEVARHAVGAGKVIPPANYPHRLNFYLVSPTGEITLEEFEEWAINRLKVLADIESHWARNKKPEDLVPFLLPRLKKTLPLSSNASQTPSSILERERRMDHYSHMILCLAFCRSEELRLRFLKAEVALFKVRWETDGPEERRRFVESCGFGWESVSDEEKERFKSQLSKMYVFKSNFNLATEPFFKDRWTKVADLVERRRVFLHGGFAYVPQEEELSLVSAEFSNRLSRSLELTAKALPRLDEDERLLPILSHLSMGFMAGITSEYVIPTNADGEEIRAEMVPELAKQSFPFCMRSLYDMLKINKHLKHEGRQQFNLFLKGIGLSVEEAIIFWRRSFSMPDDKFNKEYKYNIRHGYGLEGSRKNYTPKSCQQIITGKNPGPGESHGCPFRHFSEQNLHSALLSTYNVSSLEAKEITKSAKDGHYHVACTRLFEIQHKDFGVGRGDGVGNGDSVDHPNKYFDASRKVRRGTVKEEEGVKKEAGVKKEVKEGVKKESAVKYEEIDDEAMMEVDV